MPMGVRNHGSKAFWGTFIFGGYPRDLRGSTRISRYFARKSNKKVRIRWKILYKIEEWDVGDLKENILPKLKMPDLIYANFSKYTLIYRYFSYFYNFF